ncbi:MAG: hypothetical protein INR62_03740 [Rhodospirillales bacterium]|nr:hypothetical protein [Acetobacter sp.]
MSYPRFSSATGRRLPVRAGRWDAAFTLVELLVAMAVGTLLIIFLFQLFNAATRAWRQGEDQAETYREARAALQMMVRDLGQTVAPMTGSVYASPTPKPAAIPPVVAPALVLDYYGDKPSNGDEINEEVYCLTTIPNDGVSSLCAVGYFCQWSANGHSKAYSLMRQYLGSGSPTVPGLFDRFKNKAGAAQLSFLDVFERSGTPPLPSITEMSSYIWDLQIRTPTTLQNPDALPKYLKTADYSTGYANALPAYLEIRFKALSESAARQLESIPTVDRHTWNDTNSANAGIYRSIILPGTRQFSARVPLQSGSANSTPVP